MIRERFCASTERKNCPGVDPDGIQIDKTHCESDECNGEYCVTSLIFLKCSATMPYRPRTTRKIL